MIGYLMDSSNLQDASLEPLLATTECRITFGPAVEGSCHSRSSWIWIPLNCLGVFIGVTSASLLSRFYFDQGGSSRWLSTWTQTAGWPLCALAVAVTSCNKGVKSLTSPTPKLLAIYASLGCLQALGNLAYAWGVSYLAASTSGVLTSTQLIFTVLFSMLLVGHRLTLHAWTAILLVTCSAIILAMDSNDDKLPGVNTAEYVLGYLMALSSSAIYGLIYPLTELTLRNFLQGAHGYVTLELLACTNLVATLVSSIGMLFSKDFQRIHKESVSFQAGPLAYYSTLIGVSIGWQLNAICSTGLIFLSSSVLTGVTQGALIPIVPAFAIIFFHDSLGVLKALAILLAICGFTSYLYGNSEKLDNLID